MPHHSLFNWIVYGLWSGGFGVTAFAIRHALLEAIVDRRLLILSGTNGSSMIEANRAIRNEAIRLIVSVCFSLLGMWALLVNDAPAPPTLRGRATLLAFLVLGALICSQTWFDRADRKRQMQPPGTLRP